jgi:hypothetical protein
VKANRSATSFQTHGGCVVVLVLCCGTSPRTTARFARGLCSFLVFWCVFCVLSF